MKSACGCDPRGTHHCAPDIGTAHLPDLADALAMTEQKSEQWEMKMTEQKSDFPCPECGHLLGPLDEDLDDPGVFVCDRCTWEGHRP